VRGNSERPRLAVYRSLKHTYAQVIDDESGRTLAAVSSLEPDLKSEIKSGSTKAAAAIIGRTIAARAIEKGIKKVALDRRHYRFHGRIAALADAARKEGLEF